ncbi:MAG: Na+/H+-dicarboxylate symporter [Candidatus Azotimanducaceae bacterium]|jgi:Na+/H+-dicarboxylate symporter
MLPATDHTNQTAQIPSVWDLPDALLGLLPGNPLSSMVEGEMLQVVVFGVVVVGIALVSMSTERSKPMLELLGTLHEVCMTVARWAMVLAPYAVFGLMAQLTSKIGFEALLGLGYYVITVLLGLSILVLFYLLMIHVFT